MCPTEELLGVWVPRTPAALATRLDALPETAEQKHVYQRGGAGGWVGGVGFVRRLRRSHLIGSRSTRREACLMVARRLTFMHK